VSGVITFFPGVSFFLGTRALGTSMARAGFSKFSPFTSPPSFSPEEGERRLVRSFLGCRFWGVDFFFGWAGLAAPLYRAAFKANQGRRRGESCPPSSKGGKPLVFLQGITEARGGSSFYPSAHEDV